MADSLITLPSDRYELLELLETKANEHEFAKRWRGFLKECSLILLPQLPVEAREWVIAADQFERGELSIADLDAIRVRACEFRETRSRDSEISALSAVMYRLWPEHDPQRWYEAASHFLDFCEEAGLGEEVWKPMLHRAFGEVVAS